MALFCSSLPQAYAARDGAIVLAQTQAMTRQVRRRIFETAQFLFDVMTPGALSDGGRGVRAAQKVRLMHAAIRRLLLATGTWDTPAVGLPINQEDMAGTLMTFSLVTVDALARVRIPVSDAEREAWIHTWNVVGFLLRIREELLPASVAESAELTDAIRRRHWAPSAAGAELARAVVDMMQEYLPGAGLDGVPVALIRYLAGDHCADLLGLSRADWTRHLVDAGSDVATALRIGEHRSPRGALIRRATFLLMRAIVRAEREGKRAQFRIPEALLDSLGADD
jgi:hypothetical protein